MDEADDCISYDNHVIRHTAVTIHKTVDKLLRI